MRQTFIHIIEDHKKIVYKVCNLYCKTKEDKEDLFQDIVLRLWKGFDSFKGNSKITTWIYRVALNTAITNYRLDERRPKLSYYNKENLHVFTEESKFDLKNEIEYLKESINKLNDIEKAIILLYLDDIAYKEIAEIVGLSYSNVATKISRIKLKLKDIMQTN